LIELGVSINIISKLSGWQKKTRSRWWAPGERRTTTPDSGEGPFLSQSHRTRAMWWRSNVGGSSDPAKYSKSLKSIETYIQRIYKMPDDIVKAIQNMIRPSFDPPEKTDKSKCLDDAGKFDPDEFKMAKFT
jgi:hypothetical protein